MTATTDIVIVGAGLAGVGLAWHLAGKRRVTVVEQGAQPCAEASAQNAGMLRRLVVDAREREWACRSHDVFAATVPEDWRESPPFRRTGSVLAFMDEDAPMARAAAALRDRGVDVERLEDDALAAAAPAMRGSPVRYGYYIESDGVCDSHALGSGFVRGARRRGVEFALDTTVDRLVCDADRVIGVSTSRGVIHADHVVLATAAWSPPFAQQVGVRRPLRPLARHLLFSEPHALATADHPWCWIEDAGLYVRPETGAFLCSPCDETEVAALRGIGSRRSIEPLGRAIAHDKLERLLPALADLRLRQGWVGLRTFTPTREALVGPDSERPGLFWMTGFGGFGVSCAFGAGEYAARCLTTGEFVHSIDGCSADA